MLVSIRLDKLSSNNNKLVRIQSMVESESGISHFEEQFAKSETAKDVPAVWLSNSTSVSMCTLENQSHINRESIRF